MLYIQSQVLKKAAASSSSSSSRLIITTEDTLKICEQLLQPFRKILARLKPLQERLKGSEHKMRHIGLRIRWTFRHRSNFLFYHKMFDSLKLTFSCLLSTLTLQCSRDIRDFSCRASKFRSQGCFKKKGSGFIRRYPGITASTSRGRYDKNRILVRVYKGFVKCRRYSLKAERATSIIYR